MGTSAVFRANSTFKTGFAKIKNKYKKQGGADGIHYPLHHIDIKLRICTSLLLGTHLLKVLLQLFKFIKV